MDLKLLGCFRLGTFYIELVGALTTSFDFQPVLTFSDLANACGPGSLGINAVVFAYNERALRQYFDAWPHVNVKVMTTYAGHL